MRVVSKFAVIGLSGFLMAALFVGSAIAESIELNLYSGDPTKARFAAQLHDEIGKYVLFSGLRLNTRGYQTTLPSTSSVSKHRLVADCPFDKPDCVPDEQNIYLAQYPSVTLKYTKYGQAVSASATVVIGYSLVTGQVRGNLIITPTGEAPSAFTILGFKK